jgi:hypothetical protein
MSLSYEITNKISKQFSAILEALCQLWKNYLCRGHVPPSVSDIASAPEILARLHYDSEWENWLQLLG